MSNPKFDPNQLRIGREKNIWSSQNLFIFEVLGLVEILCGIIYFVRIGPEIKNQKFEQNWLRIDWDPSMWNVWGWGS